MKILKTLAIAACLFAQTSIVVAQSTPITITITDRIQYEGISQAYCSDVARAAAFGRGKKLGHYEVIDTLTTGLAMRAELSQLTRTAAQRLVTVLVSRIYLDKVADAANLEALSRAECAWANKTLEGLTALTRQ